MKICVLGFEGATSKLVLEDERLVNLRRLMDIGVYGSLKSVVPPAAVPGWMCMATSRDPGSLGVYGPRVRTDVSHKAPEVFTSCPEDAIWEHLRREGKKAVTVNVPPDCSPDIGYAADSSTLPDEIFSTSGKQWHEARALLSQQEWDYFHFVDTGLEFLRTEFNAQSTQVFQNYSLRFDEQVGSVLELLDEDTIVLVTSTHGVRRNSDLNEWLVRAGYLVLNDVSKNWLFEMQSVDWNRTRAWSDGGDSCQIFFNLRGREPSGTVSASGHESFQDELIEEVKTLSREEGKPPLSAFKPKEIYRSVRGVVPDLIACFDWENAQNGVFIMAAPGCPLSGEFEGAHLLDLAPTLLDLAGYEIPESVQGRSLVAGLGRKASDGSSSVEDEKIVRDRLAGLGYI